MAVIGNGVSLYSMKFEDFHFTMNLATGITTADVGKAVSIDASGPNKVKLAADNDVIFGRLEVVENRTQEGILVGTVATRFIDKLPVDTGAAGTWAVGDTVVGGGAGEVKIKGEGTPAPDHTMNVVVEIIDANTVVVAKV